MIISTGALFGTCNNIIYVDAGAVSFLHDGSSWERAYLDLQSALNEAEACDDIQEIWMAGGTYKPTIDSKGRTTTGTENFVYFISTDMVIRGGFCGWENAANQRVNFLCPTVLSGDHLGDDVRISDKDNLDFPFSNDVDNSYNIMWTRNLTSASIIDGVTFTAGNADHPSVFFKQIGGAIFNDSRGLNDTSSPRLTNCIFQYNKSQKGGGAIYNYGIEGNASPVFTNCQFRYNYSEDHGGAFYNRAEGASFESSPAFISCLIENNNASLSGGGIYSINESMAIAKPRISQSTFVHNKAKLGGGLYINRTNGSSDPISINGSIFYFNTATDDITTASYGRNNTSVTLQYSLFPEAVVDQINYNINAAPLFVNQMNNFRLRPTSPAINFGEEDTPFMLTISSRDIDDNSRRLGGLMDIGAYEFLTCPSTNIIYVDDDSNSFRNGAGPSSALSSLNMALNMACNCDNSPTIQIAEGRYVPHRLADLSVDDDHTQHKFEITCSVDLQGSGDVVLTGDVSNNDAQAPFPGIFREDNTDHLLTATDVSSVTVAGIEFQGANLEAVLIGSQNVDFFECFFKENADDVLKIIPSADTINLVRIHTCIFENNYKLEDVQMDGCIHIEGSGRTEVRVIKSIFEDNDLGGIYLNLQDSSTAFIHDSGFAKNGSDLGAGIEISDAVGQTSSYRISNCVFVDNTAQGGAAIYGSREGNTHYSISNCTTFRNYTGSVQRGSIDFAGDEGSAVIKDCIFWDNRNDAGLGEISGDMDISYSLLQADTCPDIAPSAVRCGEVMAYNVYPLFQDTADYDFRLKTGSFAIDRGSKRFDPFLPNGEDVNGDARIVSNRIDLGAYEYQPNYPSECDSVIVNPSSTSDFTIDMTVIAEAGIELSKDYMTPSTGALFLDAPSVDIFPSLEIEAGAVLEVHSVGCGGL